MLLYLQIKKVLVKVEKKYCKLNQTKQIFNQT